MKFPKPEKKKKVKSYSRNECFNTLYKNGKTRCELMFDYQPDPNKKQGCKKSIWLDPAHRHKRRWYLGKGDLINDYNEIILACRYCHLIIEKDPQLTKEVFNRLRGLK